MVYYDFKKNGIQIDIGELRKYFDSRIDSICDKAKSEQCLEFIKELLFNTILIDLGIKATWTGPFKVEVVDEFFTTCVIENPSDPIIKYRAIFEDLLYKEYSFRSWH